MRFITVEEFDTLKVYELDNATYKRLEKAFAQVCGYAGAERLLAKFMEKTIREISVNSFVDVMSIIKIL